MILRRPPPPAHRAWNSHWGAPSGRRWGWRLLRHRKKLAWLAPRVVGPFAFQPNNDTRVVEYPWAFFAVSLRPRMHAVEIGGSLAGFQFVLDKSGVDVVNVDPGEKASGLGWSVDQRSIARLNRAFGTHVELRNCTLQEAGLPDGSVDVIFSISTIEHIPPAELPSLMSEVTRVLRPGGHVVLTVDLFLDIRPFTRRTTNRFGWNANIREIVSASGLALVQGNPAELCGFEEFDPEQVLAHLSDYYVGSGYPCCAQALVLQRPPVST